MRYAQGGGLTAEGRRRRELVRLAAVESFERRCPVADIAAELRVSERSVQRWTLARIRDLIAATFRVQYTIPGIWYLLRRRGWTCQLGARRAVERDDGAIEVWRKETWPRVKEPRRPLAPGSSSRTRPASR